MRRGDNRRNPWLPTTRAWEGTIIKIGMGGVCPLALLAVGDCASVARGTTEQVVVKSLPEDATTRTTLRHSCARSLCTIEVSRKTEFTALAEREGYYPGSLHVGTRFSEGARWAWPATC